MLIGNFQFHPAVNDIGCQAVHADDLLIPGTVTEVLGSDFPEGIAVGNGMNSITYRVNQGAVAVEHTVARIGIRAFLGIGQNLVGSLLGLGIGPGLADAIQNFRFRSRGRSGRGGSAAESLCHLGSQIAQAAVQPVTRAGFVGKPAMDGQNHLIGLWRVVQRLGLIRKPDQLLLPVALADIRTQLDQGIVDLAVHGVGCGGVAGALDSNSPLVILPAGGAPGAVLFLHAEGNPAVRADAVVAAGLTVSADEAVADAFSGGLPHNTVGRYPINGMGALTGVVGTQLRVCHQRAVGIGHYCTSFPSERL